jgi:hypothetical protein
MFTKRVHVFMAGDQTSAQGVARSFSPKDLDQVVKSYDPKVHEAPLVLGHQGDSDSLPSYGWIKGFEREGDNLYANVAFTDVAKDLVKDGHYRKVSISFYSPDSQINPHPGQWTARHLALLGAAPPAVKGLEPFNFAEWDQRVGVYDFAVALNPEQVFDEDLGPTMIRELSPMEMLKEKLDAARSEMQAEVNKLTDNTSPEAETEDASAEVEAQEDSASEVENPSNPANYSERPRRGDNARSVAALEDQFPVESKFMEHEGISRKKKSTPHGQVSQVVENVYKEKGGFPEKAKAKKAMKMEDEALSADHEEMGADNPKMRNPRMEPGKVNYAEGGPKNYVGADRYDTSKSDEQDEDRYDDGKTSEENASFGRYKTAKGKEQHDAGRPAAKSSEQDNDRVSKGQYKDPENEGRYTDEEMDQVYNADQYDDDVDYGVNDAKTASGSNPAGREDSETKMPTEVEEMPSDEVFGVKVKNVKDAANARVMYIKGGEKMPKSHGGGIKGSVMADYAEPEPAEVTGKEGVYAEGKKKILSGEFEGGPDEMTLKTGGVYAESYKGEPKSTKKALTPGAFDSDQDEEPAEMTGPGGVTGGADHRELPPALKKRAQEVKEQGHFAEDHAELEHQAGIPKSKKDQLSGEYEGGVAEETGPSGVSTGYAEHEENDNPYTRTGFGSTYKEEEADMDEEEFCDMPMGKGKKAMMPEYAEFMEQLEALKAENARIKHEYREAQIARKRDQIHSFVEGLYEQGKMVDSIIPERKLIEFAEGLEFGVLEFSEGETATGLLFSILDNLPNLVDFSEYAGGSMKFVDEADLDPHQKALSMVEKSGGEMDYVEALKKAMYS